MIAYIIRRLALIVPTIVGILALNFFIVQLAPGGPIEQLLAEVQGTAVSATARITGQGGEVAPPNSAGQGLTGQYRGAAGLEPEYIAQLERQFGFDKPLPERFFAMLVNYATFDLGESYFQDRGVVDLVVDKLPVSITLGLWTTLLVYFIGIPLGIAKAVRDGSRFDLWTSGIIVMGYAIPSFLLAVLLIVVFAGGEYLQWFPLRGLTSPEFGEMSWWQQVADYLWHISLPVFALVIGSFARQV